MPINMSCPSCGKTLAAPDSAAGKRAKCPSCGQIMIVPAEGAAGEMFSTPPPPPSTLSPRAARAPGSSAVPPDDAAPSNRVSSSSAPGGGESWLDDQGNVGATPGVAAPDAGGEQRRPCPECGEMIIATAVKCRFCGALFDPRLKGRTSTSRLEAVPNYLAQAILVTLFCCLPFGIVAIVYAAQVNGRIQVGDTRGAISASESAKTWCWVSFGCGFVPLVLWFILAFIGAIAH